MEKLEITKNLLYEISDGDFNAFSKFYNIYFHKVNNFTKYFIKSNEICEEIISDVFLTIWNLRNNISNIENIEAFLFTITKNKSYNYINQNKKPYTFIDNIFIEISDFNNPENIMLTNEMQKIINIAINKLPEKCKIIFLMSREENLTYKDIGKILSISEKTVNNQIVMAIKKLHFILKDYIKFY